MQLRAAVIARDSALARQVQSMQDRLRALMRERDGAQMVTAAAAAVTRAREAAQEDPLEDGRCRPTWNAA